MAASSSTMAIRRFIRQGYRLRACGESTVALPLCAIILRCRGTFAPAGRPAAGAQYSGDLRENLPERVAGESAGAAPPRALEQLAGTARAAGDCHHLKRIVELRTRAVLACGAGVAPTGALANDKNQPAAEDLMFTQLIDPLGNLTLTCLVALIPVVSLLVMLAIWRLPAWLATLLGSLLTFVMAAWIWKMPLDQGVHAYVYGAATGVWNVNWITFWGMVLFNTLAVSGVFENCRRWLIAQGSMDVRVQTMLFAWVFGALLEGLVGFGYPWAVVAPILISLGISDLNAIRVAAIANNAPVSYGALGAPIITLAAVTSYPLLALSGSVGTIVAVLALLPPWVLLYLVSGWEGLKGGWPLAVVGSLGYIAGQYPVAVHLGPYLPDVAGAIVCFAALLLLLKVWQPRSILGYGGVPVDAAAARQTQGHGL